MSTLRVLQTARRCIGAGGLIDLVFITFTRAREALFEFLSRMRSEGWTHLRSDYPESSPERMAAWWSRGQKSDVESPKTEVTADHQ